jgi:tight adherence protein B
MSARLRIGLLGGLAVLAAVVASTAGGDTGGIRIAQAAASFPERALVLTLPRRIALDAGSVEVRENGRLVGRRELVPGLASRAGAIGFVLVLDASNSMRGRPVADAVKAARAFAAERSAAQSFGLITFNASPKTRLQPTTAAGAIDNALARVPSLALGTRLRDAALRAVAVLKESKVEAGSVVLLSDGADTGSDASTAEVVAAARRANVRIFSIGLRSFQFRPDQLRALAEGTGGLYSEASTSAQLTPIYRALGGQLAREYLIHYTSAAQQGRHVYVTVRVPALGSAGLDYVAPASPAGTLERSLWQRIVLSPASVVAVASFAALLAAVAALLAVRAARRPLTRRLADFVAVSDLAAGTNEDGNALARIAERSLSRFQVWQRFAADAEIARVRPSPEALALTAGAAALAVGPLAVVATGQPLLLVLTVVPPLLARAFVKRKLAAVRRGFAEQLPDALQMLASALRAGHGMSSALGVVAGDSSEPTRGELERALADERLGTPLEDALTGAARRMESGDLEQVALVAALHRETGGNTAEVIDRVHDTVRERAELARMVRTLTAQGRMARWILTALPIVVGLVASLLVPSYTGVLYRTGVGQVLVALAVAMVIAGSLAVKRIVEIEV